MSSARPLGHFVDSSVLLYAVGNEHPMRSPCRRFLDDSANYPLHASVEAMQEFVFHRLRRSDRAAAVTVTQRMRSTLVLHDFTADVLDQALRLIADTALRGRDAVMAASALSAGFDHIVSVDEDFDDVAVLRRIQP